ncbi:MAG: hypothetical protein PHG08_00035 [Bacilli bacterium]|nr:hypothetical protein [Bacilli bacterium]
MYKHDQNKLYRVHNILRWGIPKDGGIYFEEMIDGCGTYLPYFTTIKYIPLFVVAEKTATRLLLNLPNFLMIMKLSGIG